MSSTYTDTRQAILDELRGKVGAELTGYRSKARRGRRSKVALEIGIAGAPEEHPDMVTVSFTVTAGDGPDGEHALDAVMGAVDRALPSYVLPVAWTTAYDDEQKQWRADGLADTFRQ